MKKYIIQVVIIIITLIMIISFNLSQKQNQTYAIGTTLADTVIALNKGTTWSSGASGVYYTNSHEYRYVGANVNNFVNFNNDMYQIIGVFDSNSHGQSSNLVKLIRARLLAAYTWGTVKDTEGNLTYTSDWTGTGYASFPNLNVLLNEYFYKKQLTSDTYGECNDWTYYSVNELNKVNNCDTLVGYGIATELQDYIENVTWYLYGDDGNSSTTMLTRANWYLCERGQYSDCTSGATGANSTTATGKIGLMYPSDYLYASGNLASSDTTSSYNNDFGVQNWMHRGHEYTITPYIKYDYGIYVIGWFNTNGGIHNGEVYNDVSMRPVFYLKSDVYVTAGDGTFDNPYQIACDACSE